MSHFVYTDLFKFNCETSNFRVCKSSNLFLEPVSTIMQWEWSFLLKKTMGDFDGAQTHDWLITIRCTAHCVKPHLKYVSLILGDLVFITSVLLWHLDDHIYLFFAPNSFITWVFCSIDNTGEHTTYPSNCLVLLSDSYRP